MGKTANLFITIIAIVVILIYGQSLLIPFIFALLLWFIGREIRVAINRLKFFKKFIPDWIESILANAMIVGIIILITSILTANIQAITENVQDKISADKAEEIINHVNEELQIDVLSMLGEEAQNIDFGSILESIFNSISGVLGDVFMIIIYALFIFMEESNFGEKLRKTFQTADRYEQTSKTLREIEKQVKRYLGLKTLVSIITGVLSYITLAIFGVDSPLFWAFLIFLLNFIPTIGSLIGTIFPFAYALFQFEDFTTPLLILGIVGVIQVVVGNILEPRLMGNSMNISSLVTILALSFWGAIWGVTGMLLSVPITVIMIIILSKFESTKAVAIMLSEKGDFEEG